MQLAREPAPLELLRLDDPAQCVAGNACREVDRDGGAGRERLREPQVGLGETRVAAFTVVGGEHPDRPAAGHERHVEPAAGAEPPGRLLVDLGVVEQGVHPLGAAALEHAAALRARSLQLQADDLGRVLAVGGLDPERPVVGRERDRDEARADQPAQPAGDQLEQARELDFARERGPDLIQRLELVRPCGRRLVEARILDRDCGLARERLDELLVGGGERALLLLGQVEVPEGTAAQQDRHPEEAAHRRMVGREADRARIVGDRLEPQRAGVGDQRAEDAAAAREGADLRRRVGVDAGVEEALERRPGLVDHAERRIAGAGQGGRGLGELLQEVVERELRAERDSRLDEAAQAIRLGRGAHRSEPIRSTGVEIRCRAERGYTRHSPPT